MPPKAIKRMPTKRGHKIGRPVLNKEVRLQGTIRENSRITFGQLGNWAGSKTFMPKSLSRGKENFRGQKKETLKIYDGNFNKSSKSFILPFDLKHQSNWIKSINVVFPKITTIKPYETASKGIGGEWGGRARSRDIKHPVCTL